MFGAEKSTEEIVSDLKQKRDEVENFRALYERYGASIRGFFAKKGVPEPDGLKDEVFVAVYRSLGALREAARFEAWLFTIANNTYKNWLKRQMAIERLEVPMPEVRIDPPAPGLNPELHVIEKEKMEKVWQALEQLPPQKRLVAILAWVHDLSPKEIASMLPITINTVYAHLHQAQKLLREALSEHFS